MKCFPYLDTGDILTEAAHGSAQMRAFRLEFQGGHTGHYLPIFCCFYLPVCAVVGRGTDGAHSPQVVERAEDHALLLRFRD